MTKIDRRDFIQKAGILPAGAMIAGNISFMACSLPISPETFDLNKQYDPWIEISRKNVKWNIDQIRKITDNKPVMAVIKCNAYGHGTVSMGKYLESIGIEGLAVVKMHEALDLCKAGVKVPILNFGPFSDEEAKLVVQNDIMQSVFNNNVVALNKVAQSQGKIARVHLKIDTGLGRVGIPYYQAYQFIKRVAGLSNIKIVGIFMTFTEDPEFDKVQLKRFNELCEKAKQNNIELGYRHAASSDAVLRLPEAHLDMVRPGILIYGHYPNDEEYKLQRIKVKPALTLKARISQVKKLRKGDSVSYHRVYKVDKNCWLATLPIGNYDGLPQLVVNNAQVLAHGNRYTFTAGMTANHSYLRFNKEDEMVSGDEIVFIGEQGKENIFVEEITKKIGNYSIYTFLMQLNPVIPRIYV